MNPNRKVVNGPITSRSNMSCCVYGCKSVHRKDKSISYHAFPKEDEPKMQVQNIQGQLVEANRRELWIDNLKLTKPPSKSLKVCSLHFVKEDFHSTGCFDKRYLIKTAVPTQNLPFVEKVPAVENGEDQVEPLAKKQRFEIVLIKEEPIEELTITNPEIIRAQSEGKTKEFATISTQTDVNFMYNNETAFNRFDLFASYCNSNKKLNKITGFKSVNIFNDILNTYSLAKTKPQNIPDKYVIILTFMKLKLNLSYVVLGTLFKMSARKCKSMFLDTIVTLAKALRCKIKFSNSNVEAIPLNFIDFCNVKIILDFFQVKIKNYRKSRLKNRNLIKFMVGVSPCGVPLHVSSIFKGSNKKLFLKSEILTKLKAGDAVMVDKGIGVKNICKARGVSVIERPVLIKNQKYCSNSKIQLATEHVIDSKRAVIGFRILKNPSRNLIPFIDKIFLIICAVSYFSKPI